MNRRIEQTFASLSALAVLAIANPASADDAAKQKADAKADKLLKAANVDPSDAKAADAKATLSD